MIKIMTTMKKSEILFNHFLFSQTMKFHLSSLQGMNVWIQPVH